ncbi:MAG: hypothetical protein J6K20_14330 [Thermoguttaceae bacterium]|nr:hypothetical protein [Thermoguttaceae bacterium]
MSSQEKKKNGWGRLWFVILLLFLAPKLGKLGRVREFMDGVDEGVAEVRQIVVLDAWNETADAYNRLAEALESTRTLEYSRRALVRCKNELLAVDLSECPSDFQAAFQDLLAAVDRAIATCDQLNGDAGFGGSLEGLGTALFDDPLAYLDDALLELKYVAQRHGVEIPE